MGDAAKARRYYEHLLKIWTTPANPRDSKRQSSTLPRASKSQKQRTQGLA